MKGQRYLSAMALIGVCLSLCSCIDSKEPLCGPEDAKMDEELIGAWRAVSEDGASDYYFVGTAGDKLPPGVMRVVTVDYDKSGKLSRPGEMLAFSVTVGNHRYLNIAFIDDKDLDQFEMAGWKPELVKGFLIVQYQVENDTLVVREMDPQAKRRLIESKKLKGTIDKNAIFFTDSAKNLADLLADPNNADLFSKTPTKYEHIKAHSAQSKADWKSR
jgi:hypothetical protein